jgi:Mg-chelatase subunit ChlD
MEEPAPPLLLVAAVVESNERAATEQATPPQPSKSTSNASSAATKPQPKQTKLSGKPSSRPTGVHGSSGTSGYAQTSVFGVQGKGSKFIYVFDRSASMEGRPLAAAKKQLLESLQSLESVQQFHIIFFNTKTQSFDNSGGGHRIAFASDRNKKLAANFVGGITADGGTDRMVALNEALNFAPDVIFFLTDADDAMSPSEMAELARANRKAQASICVIEFGKKPSPTPNNFLARLAHDNGGQYGYVDTTKLK